jgi:hypothetical protein
MGTDCFQWVSVFTASILDSSTSRPFETTLYLEGAVTINSQVALS